jgi:predicted dehydrogenase
MTRRGALTRRTFLTRSAAAVGAAAAWPALVPASVLDANERPRIGHIGLRNRGEQNLNALLKRSVAACDVDKEVLAKTLEAAEKKGQKLDGSGDYRRLLERKDVDAVVISTPDHWHALMTIHACEAGKDVYCEKPLTLTIAEGRAMVAAARKHGRIVQTGSQQRSDGRFRLACELVRSGRLGKLERVLVGIEGVNFEGPAVPDSEPPPHLDYDFWLGPAPSRPYNPKRVHYNFRFFWDYSGGQITNWGAHHLDIAQWGMGTDGGGPVEVEGTARYHPQGWYEVPEHFAVTYRYASGVVVECGMGQRGGATFIASEGRIHVDRRQIASEPKEILDRPLGEGDVRLYKSANHYEDWLECIESRKLPVCDVEIGHRTATVCHLGNIAIRTGRKVRWDPVKEEVIGDAEAQRWVTKAYRKPWRLG